MKIAKSMNTLAAVGTLSAMLLCPGYPLSALAVDSLVTPEIRAIVDSPDRSADDRKADQRRQPAKMLAFVGVQPGMTVLDIGTGRGYTAELLVRSVGPSGLVVAQNETIISDKYLKGEPPARFGTDMMRNVTYVVRPYDDPIPSGAGPFDLVTIM
ncbi:MAG: methyltransferase, partial [Burkholderiales bacterium]|nr:methyltransferase [Burkholderiales bacterium]